jgi:predicted component of type VI protein secretion system
MLEKVTVVERIEILEDGTIQIREATRILEDGKLLSQSFHRSVVSPDKEDMTDQHEKVQTIASALWTKKVKDEFKAKKEEAKVL